EEGSELGEGVKGGLAGLLLGAEVGERSGRSLGPAWRRWGKLNRPRGRAAFGGCSADRPRSGAAVAARRAAGTAGTAAKLARSTTRWAAASWTEPRALAPWREPGPLATLRLRRAARPPLARVTTLRTAHSLTALRRATLL